MPRIYKGTTPKIAVMFYPCIIDTDLLTNLTISLYTENTTDSIIIPMEEITLKDNIALFELPKYKLDMLGDGVVKYISEGAYNSDDFIFDRYSDYTIVTPVEYQPQDIYIQQIKYVTKAEYENLKTNGKLEENIYLISDATPQDNLKTINGESLVGDGDITIEGNVDLSDYYTKGETDNKYQPKGNYLTSIPEEYVTDSELTEKGYATEQWVDDKGYLKEIPEEYITETELNDVIANISCDVPHVVITTQSATATSLIYEGDLNAVINAVKNHTPYFAFFYNKATYYGVRYSLYEVNYVYYNSQDDRGVFYVHAEGGGGKHVVNNLPFSFDGVNYNLGEINMTYHNYLTSVPEEYVTEDELNEAIANIDSGNNIVSSTIFLEAIGDFGNKKILSDKVGYEEHNRAVYDRLYNIVKQENPSFSDETFIVNAEFNMNGLTSRMNGILSYGGDIIFSTFSIFMTTNINYSLWSDVEMFIQNYINNDPMEFVIDVAHIDYHNIATTKYVDEQLGNVNNILENIIG